MKNLFPIFFLLGSLISLSANAQNATAKEPPLCPRAQLAVQVLGSGGPEMDDRRASTSYLLWINGKARIMIDAGSGSSFRFEQSGARFNDIDAVLVSHLHTDHISELESYIKGSYFSKRQHELWLYGPRGNDLVPSIKKWTELLYSAKPAPYRYLHDYFDLDPNARYKVRVQVVPENTKQDQIWSHRFEEQQIKISAVYVPHGPIPALSWRIDLRGKSIVFTGDTNGNSKELQRLLKNADLVFAHHAIPENASNIAKRLHMPPSKIGELAAKANIANLVLSHRMRRTIGQELNSQKAIQASYKGPLTFAEDLDCYAIR